MAYKVAPTCAKKATTKRIHDGNKTWSVIQ